MPFGDQNFSDGISGFTPTQAGASHEIVVFFSLFSGHIKFKETFLQVYKQQTFVRSDLSSKDDKIVLFNNHLDYNE